VAADRETLVCPDPFKACIARSIYVRYSCGVAPGKRIPLVVLQILKLR